MSEQITGASDRRLLRRLRIAHGHLGKVLDMAEKGEPSGLVQQQLSAVISALKSVSVILTVDHVSSSLQGIDPELLTKAVNELEEMLERSTK